MRDLSEFSTFPFELPVTGRCSALLPDLPDEEVRHAGEQVARILPAGTGTARP